MWAGGQGWMKGKLYISEHDKMCFMDCHTKTAVKHHHMQPLYTVAEGNQNVRESGCLQISINFFSAFRQ